MSSTKSHLVSILLLALIIEASSQDNLCKSRSRFCAADSNEPWTYRGLKGPYFWWVRYPNCSSDSQSPINIRTSGVVEDNNLAQLKLENYDLPLTKASIENNGHTIEVTPDDDVARFVTINDETYTLRQFHFHWGCRPSKGSEHAVNGNFYAMEMHLVHMSEDEKIAVVGVFLKEQDENNPALQGIVNQLPEVMYNGREAELEPGLNLNDLVPSNPTSYYRYDGSLTTPECSEGVTWSVIPDPIPVGSAQMEEFRKLYSASEEEAAPGCKLAGNFRPVQSLNGRTVYLSQ